MENILWEIIDERLLLLNTCAKIVLLIENENENGRIFYEKVKMKSETERFLRKRHKKEP